MSSLASGPVDGYGLDILWTLIFIGAGGVWIFATFCQAVRGFIDGGDTMGRHDAAEDWNRRETAPYVYKGDMGTEMGNTEDDVNKVRKQHDQAPVRSSGGNRNAPVTNNSNATAKKTSWLTGKPKK